MEAVKKDLPATTPLSQEQIVVATALGLFIIFSIATDGFLSVDNLLSLLKNVSVLGVLALAMSVVVIGRGIDLAIVPVMVISTAFFLVLYNSGMSPLIAGACGLGFALAVGLAQGVLIAYGEVPAIFATLAGGVAVYGFGQFFLIEQDVNYLPDDATLLPFVGNTNALGIPLIVYALVLIACAFHVFLRYTKFGRFVYAMGDNPAAARLAGISVRTMTVLQYILSSLTAFIGGLMTLASVSSMSTRIINSTMVYDIILVVVIGGIGLNGGKGAVRNVLAGTVLIGILLNGMTLLDIPYSIQSIVKGAILLLAILVDSYMNPRDEQTEKQGDI
ncbi:ABC transporter permease [Sinorhizobium sp. GL28]|uniref:ABC transporter permease n=1 Tax=Sinorhizobium sp. GL28 TaxID=1358418 RepID=UPI00071CCC2A|nr:ABC transporter permease [Sinorhizobium sp. GL28]KSV87268.1 hypothetical protein N184_31465 [Sinorhizobium sp. GL28]